MMRNVSPDAKRDAFARFVRGDRPETFADEIGVSVRSIYYWAQQENWHAAKKQAWREAKEKMLQSAASEIAGHQKKLLNVVLASLGKYAANLEKGKVNPRTAGDLRQLVHSFQLLTGSPTTILEASGEAASSPFDAFMRTHGDAILEAVQRRHAPTNGHGDPDDITGMDDA